MSHFPYKAGDWLAFCDQCGRKCYASELTKRWDNLMVHKDPAQGCWETRHPQDFVRAVPDQKPVAFVRREPADIDLVVDYDETFTEAEYAQIPAGTFGDYS